MQLWEALVTGGVGVATFLLFRHVYISHVRKDVPFGEDTHPVLKRLRRPVHGCHR